MLRVPGSALSVCTHTVCVCGSVRQSEGVLKCSPCVSVCVCVCVCVCVERGGMAYGIFIFIYLNIYICICFYDCYVYLHLDQLNFPILG